MPADPTLVYTPKSHLSRDSMVHLIEAGQTVLVPAKAQVDGQGNRLWPPGRIVARVEDLPTEAELAQEDPEAQRQLAQRLQAQIRAAQLQLAELPIPGAQAVSPPPAAPGSPESGLIPEAEARAIFDEQETQHRNRVEALEAQIRDLKARAAQRDDKPLPPADPTPLPIPDPATEETGKPGKTGNKPK